MAKTKERGIRAVEDLACMLSKLLDLRAQAETLETKIRETAARQAAEADQALRKLGGPAKLQRSERTPRTPEARDGKLSKGRHGAGARILAYLQKQGGVCEAATIAVAIGAGEDAKAKKLTSVSLHRLARKGLVERVGRGTWRLFKTSTKNDEHAEAVAWAKAHPEDPRAAKILKLAQQP